MVTIKEVFEELDEQVLQEMIIRMASRIYTKEEGKMPLPLCNPVAMQMLMGHIHERFMVICEQSGIDAEHIFHDGVIDTKLKMKPRS